MSKIKYVIAQRIETKGNRMGVRGTLEIETCAVLQEGMFLDDAFYHRDDQAKIAQVTYVTGEDYFYVEMEPIKKPMADEERVKTTFEDHGWKVYRS